MRSLSFVAMRGRVARSAVRDVSSSSRMLPAAAVMLGTGLVLGACANSQSNYDGYSQVGASQSSRGGVSRTVKVERDSNDPSEPFSRNDRPAPETATGSQRASNRAPQILTRTTPISDREAQAIIIQAMIAHERRNP